MIAKTANALFKLLGEPPIPKLEPVDGYANGFSPAYLAQWKKDMAAFNESYGEELQQAVEEQLK